MIKLRTLLFLIVLATTTLQAQPPIRKIEDLLFMSGKWKTKSSLGDMEIIWSEPFGNSMMGAYRCVKNDTIVFYQFIVIEQTTTGPVMKLRHFSPGNFAWEDKDKPYSYPLMFLESDRARFERPDKKTALTYHLVSPEKLLVIIETQDKRGKWVQDEFEYTSVKD